MFEVRMELGLNCWRIWNGLILRVRSDLLTRIDHNLGLDLVLVSIFSLLSICPYCWMTLSMFTFYIDNSSQNNLVFIAVKCIYIIHIVQALLIHFTPYIYFSLWLTFVLGLLQAYLHFTYVYFALVYQVLTLSHFPVLW